MKITVLGSTGSVGENAIRIIRANPSRFRVIGLSCWEDVKKCIPLIEELKPKIVAVKGEREAEMIKKRGIKVVKGIKGLQEISSEKVDLILNAVAGFNGLFATISAIENRNRLALANKESLVAGGELINKMLKKFGGEIIPVDSEHSSLYRLLNAKKEVKRIILTASGGPFLFYSRDQLEKVKVKDALKHPKWKMGKKITVDSASFMNKSLEIIEAHHLFGMPPEKIDVLIHPEAVVHSLVELEDGSLFAHLSPPDMRFPIAFALGIEKNAEIGVKKLDLSSLRNLRFFPPEGECRKAINLARSVIKKGGTSGAILNAANEVAVESFLEGKLKFLYILKVVEKVLKKVSIQPVSDLNDILSADKKARDVAREIIEKGEIS